MSHQRPTPRTMYFVIVGWCIVGGALRVALFLEHGLTPDVLPWISIGLGFAGIVRAFWPVKAPQSLQQE